MRSFAAKWEAFRARRNARLRSPDGWLALTGLHWLAPGETRVRGLPGTFTIAGGEVRLDASPADGYVLRGAPVISAVLATGAPAVDGDRLRLDSRSLAVIERSGRLAVRVWDAESPALQAFQGVDAFPADPRWRVQARWEAYDPPRKIEVPNVLGTSSEKSSPGRAHFEVDGRALALEPTLEKSGSLFFVFRDETAGKETYGAGRFLHAAPPREGEVILDFNRAINPPCAFTPFATCPLPLPGNVLPIRIEAGEKRWGD